MLTSTCSQHVRKAHVFASDSYVAWPRAIVCVHAPCVVEPEEGGGVSESKGDEESKEAPVDPDEARPGTSHQSTLSPHVYHYIDVPSRRLGSV
jgi:hypothetical protein